MDELSAALADLGDYYPGSKRTRRAVAPVPSVEPEPERWDAHPFYLTVDGEKREFFFIGALADALHLRPVTVRKWLSEGILPKERYRLQGNTVKGSRRLWTRLEIEGLARLAKEEGLFEGKSVRRSGFPARAKELFRSLKASKP